MRPPSQRRALGVLFAALALGFAGIAAAAARGDRWVIAAAAAVLAVWIGTMAARALK